MRFFAFIFGAVVALIPVAIVAAAPGSVTGLQIDFRDDQTVSVSWEKLDDPNIAYYRVYYSSQSIIQNQGMYDDFEQTEGPLGLYVFSGLVPDTDFYVAVLAVNDLGEESEFFAEEAYMHIPGGAPSIAPTIEEEPPVLQIPTEGTEPAPLPAEAGVPTLVPEIGPFELVSAFAVSPTEVLAIFSQSVTNEAFDAVAPAFTISDADGNILPVLGLTVLDPTTVSIATEKQDSLVYELLVNENVQSEFGFPISPDNLAILFVGAPEELPTLPEVPAEVPTEPEPEPEPVEEPPEIDLSGLPGDVKNLNMRAIRTPTGLYDIVAIWNLDNLPEGIVSYMVGQSFDRGKTFLGPEIVPMTFTELRVSGISSRHYGIMMQTVDGEGDISPGVFVTIDLGTMKVDSWTPDLKAILTQLEPTPEPPAPPVPTIPDEPTVIPERPGQLPSAGTTFVLMTLMFSGAVAGRKVACRKK